MELFISHGLAGRLNGEGLFGGLGGEVGFLRRLPFGMDILTADWSFGTWVMFCGVHGGSEVILRYAL